MEEGRGREEVKIETFLANLTSLSPAQGPCSEPAADLLQHSPSLNPEERQGRGRECVGEDTSTLCLVGRERESHTQCPFHYQQMGLF
jgi:hypothetical protein